MLSTSGVRRKKLSAASRHRASAAARDSDSDDNEDEDDCLTDINDGRCQLCHKICFLSAVSPSVCLSVRPSVRPSGAVCLCSSDQLVLIDTRLSVYHCVSQCNRFVINSVVV